MKKVLFVSRYNFENPACGIFVGTKKNFDIINSFAHVDTFFGKYFLNNAKGFKKFFNNIRFLLSRCYCFTNNEIKRITKKAKEGDFDIVFLDSSDCGRISKILKKRTQAKVVTFFHNAEVKVFNVPNKGIGIFTKLRRFIIKKICMLNERKALTFSDEIIVLSQRDLDDLKQFYPKTMEKIQKENINIIPITLENKLTEADKKKMLEKRNDKPHGLFLGSYFGYNYEGIKWFIENVAQNTQADYLVVGRDFDQVAQELTRPNVKVMGRQDDIKPFYLNADFVIAPIFDGSGMKYKTCEALMFGKTIFGTDEGFSGFDLNFEKVGGLCNSAEEFATAINNFVSSPSKKYNDYSHSEFMKKYSNEAVKSKFEAIFKNS